MLYTRNKDQKPRPNWRRIILAIVVVLVLGVSVYFLVSGLSGTPESRGTPTPSPTPSLAPGSPDAEPTPGVDPTKAPDPATAEPSPTPGLTGTRAMTIGAVGDNGINDNILQAARTDGGYNYAPMFEKIKPYLENYDYLLGNLETTIALEGPYDGTKASADLLTAMKDAGFDVLGLTNDQALKHGVAGAQNTARIVKDNGLTGVGAYENAQGYAAPAILEGEDMRVAVLAYTTLKTEGEEDGTGVIKYLDDATLKADMDAIAAMEPGVDFVVAMVHWGEENNKEVTQAQKDWAQKLADAGVGAIIGSHPHFMQELTQIKAADGRDVLVAYSLGNFLFYQRTEGRDMGAILNFTIVKDYDNGTCKFENVEYIPVWVLRYSFNGKYSFEIMHVGEYAGKSYQNFSQEDKTRIKAVADQVKALLGESVGKMNTDVIAQEE